MGYGEVGGGGSVQWQICYKNPKDSAALPTPPPLKVPQGRGIDKDETNGESLFFVVDGGTVVQLDNGRVIVEVKLTKKDDVVLLWGTDIPAALNRLAIAKAEIAAELAATDAGV